MKRFYIAAAAFVVLISLPGICRAEFVFKKDGAIIHGSVVSDEVTTISVKNEAGTIEVIERKDILRIIYTDLFLGKVYARLTSGEVVEGYQVYENRDSFYFRKDITKPEEIAIPRKKVMFIVRTNPTDVRGISHTLSIDAAWSPPFKPAKYYRLFIRDVKGQEEKFNLVAETSDLSYAIKGLKKSWIYEIYATAVSDTGEESLPSEKVVAATLPESPVKMSIMEKLSSDAKTVALTFSWDEVSDAESRVKSYNLYEIIGGERKKKGSSPKGEFLIDNYPAEGRHWFSVVAVNDDLTESNEIKAVYDAGFRLPVRVMGAYLYPMGSMRDLALAGYGGLLDIGISGRNLGMGIETGYLMFSCAEDVKQMVMIPALLRFEYRLPLFWIFSFSPVIKAGVSYDMIQYIVHDTADPLITRTKSANSFDAMASAGLYLQAEIADKINVFCGAEYGTVFQQSGMMSFAGCMFGAGMVF